MKARELYLLGIPKGDAMQAAVDAIAKAARSGMDKTTLRETITRLADNPDDFADDPQFGELVKAIKKVEQAQARYKQREAPAPWKQWGEGLEAGAVQQMENACKLPVAAAGALMPDAHQGYGLPIGGVLATQGCVIPYAVGVDIACRMKMTVLDLPVVALENQTDRLKNALIRETRFGVGASFRKRHDHDVMDDNAWSLTQLLAELKDNAWAQLGTSGSGNHFVEFGELTLEQGELGLEAGTYLALLSHSGSRGTGATVASHYSKLAAAQHPELPKELVHLAWLDLASEVGIEYWESMQLMGRYAAANHALIHQMIASNLGVEVLLDVENHHNFAWRETHDGREVIVHRKGATPAGEGALGIIPGSMGTPGYVVRGKGQRESLNSASHGAGRKMSRTQAKKEFTIKEMNEFLERNNVTLLSAGLDEAPMSYKDIHEVMAAQADLVEIVAEFKPRLVKMAPAGERPED